MHMPDVGALRWIVVDESAGRRDLGTFVLYEEPDGEGCDYTEGSETSHNTSSNGTGMGASSSVLR